MVRVMRILITGAAGFIGVHLVNRLLNDSRVDKVIGVDNMNNFFALKAARLSLINQLKSKKWKFIFGDIDYPDSFQRALTEFNPDVVINLAAQAGVPFSRYHTEKTFLPNVVGFFNVLETCRKFHVKHLIYASSSSVYGNDAPNCDSPLSFYAATKRANEIFAYSYAQNFKLATTGLRFFSVYGSFGRPDMLYQKVVNKFLAGKKVSLFNFGTIRRDFTFVADVVECILRVIFQKPQEKFNLYDVGRNNPVDILFFVETLIREFISAGVFNRDFEYYSDLIRLVPALKTDILTTCADVQPFDRDFNYSPKTDIADGLKIFARQFNSSSLKEMI